ncbi:MAG: DUF2867 domain-containing protein [Acidobacteriota bacterium]|nr:DUF2867 domain-containing protein [Acidobacteriota bacterium]
MLIDSFLPEYDFSETHDIKIRATPETVFRTLNAVDLCESAAVRWLFRLRGLPTRGMTLRGIQRLRFEVLGESENRELLLGLAGRFWTIKGDLQKINSQNFREFNEKGFAKAVWNFSLDKAAGETRLTTETRIKCLDAESRKKFGFYWILIKPFSALIRKEILKAIKHRAEKL